MRARKRRAGNETLSNVDDSAEKSLQQTTMKTMTTLLDSVATVVTTSVFMKHSCVPDVAEAEVAALTPLSLSHKSWFTNRVPRRWREQRPRFDRIEDFLTRLVALPNRGFVDFPSEFSSPVRISLSLSPCFFPLALVGANSSLPRVGWAYSSYWSIGACEPA